MGLKFLKSNLGNVYIYHFYHIYHKDLPEAQQCEANHLKKNALKGLLDNNSLIKGDALSNGGRQRVNEPGYDQCVATFPRRIQKIRRRRNGIKPNRKHILLLKIKAIQKKRDNEL